MSKYCWWLGIVSIFLALRLTASPAPGDLLPELIAHYESDLDDLSKVYIFPNSPEYYLRFRRLHQEALTGLQALSFDRLSTSDKVDYVLWQRTLRHSLLEIDQAEQVYDSALFAIPFAQNLMDLQVKRRRGHTPDVQLIARTLDSVGYELRLARARLDKHPPLSRAQIKMIVDVTESIREGLKNVNSFYEGYDPGYTWWVKGPYHLADSALGAYVAYIAGMVKATDAVNPIGEDKLKELLKYELIPYGPNDLVDIANKQFAWCEVEMKKAAAELGYGDNWKAALEKIKEHHEWPGGQPEMVNNLAEQAIKFVESKDLVTIPPVAKEAWRMFMLTPEEQRFAPFFLGGESIWIGFPTSEMPDSIKVMSMRSNNYGFSHATVFHELIPGHNLQGFMNKRHRSYRSLFETPFSVEGWALYWEMLLWDKGFQATPEEKIGALFWRMHRCARIIFSLNYHLGKWTPQQCVDFLVEKVGHERFSAESEVRRSFHGDYGPLYQLAYMMGGLQLRALHHELVDAGKMTDKAFHDAFLHEGTMPIEMFRATITNQPLHPDYTPQWKFAGLLP